MGIRDLAEISLGGDTNWKYPGEVRDDCPFWLEHFMTQDRIDGAKSVFPQLFKEEK